MNAKRFFTLVAVIFFAPVFPTFAADKKIILVAGKPSHGPGDHEHNAGVLLLKKCLDEVRGVKTEVQLNGWPDDDKIFDGADAIVLYMDGGAAHPALQADRLQKLDALMKKGVGLACLHYAVEPTIEKGEEEFLDWIGGAFEINRSVNPHWNADFKALPKHPITRGVKPFKIKDEWYFNMRFRDKMQGVTPILTAVPTPDTMERKDGTHEGNPAVREAVKRGESQTVAWACERKDGGRGFGFTGGHMHDNWGDENFRKTVLNAILWIAKAKVPKNGVESKIAGEDLKQNLDPKGEKKVAVKSVNDSSAKQSVPPASPENQTKPKFKSGILQSGRVPVDVDITGAKSLWLVVSDGGNGYLCDWADWIEPKLIRADGSVLKLTDLKWKSATTGFGEVGINKNVQGAPLKMDHRIFTNGIGTHAPSIIEYELPETNFTRFMAKVGPDHGGVDQNGGTSVEFLVFTATPPATISKITNESESAGGGYGFEAAKDFLKTATVADGLEATLFAAEPMVRNPTDIDIDARGRVWVCEGVNYRSSFKPWGTLQPEGDRIVILEDTNGDGVADSGKTFYQSTNINSALGICVIGNKVVVSCSPNIFVLTDTDGDDKADKTEILFSGIGGFDHDHGAHAMVFGPDGKLYFNFGNAGEQLKDKNGNFVTDATGKKISKENFRQGIVFRCNPDGSEVEVLGQNFRNPYEVAVDSFGTLWQSDNDDDGNRGVRINYVMEFGNYGYTDEMTGAGWTQKRTNLEEDTPSRHWHLNDPGVIPNLLMTGAGAPTGMTIYEGKLLPEKFQNQMIHCDAGPRVVRSYSVKSDGAGYKAEVNDIFSSSDAWFRPSDVCVAPDGSIYVSDWNDSGVGGHNMADHESKTIKGRIYRIAPKGSKPSVPRLNFTTISRTIEALKSPNMATRFLAWDELNALGENSEKELLKLWKSDDQRMRARALQLLARIKGKEKKYVEQALQDKNSDLRIAGLRIARALKLDLIPMVKLLANDSNPQVRRECAIALRHNSSPEAPKLWAQLAQQHDGKDRWYLEALGIGADEQEDKFFQAWLELIGENWNTPEGRDIIWRSRSTKAPAYLAKIIADLKTTDKERSRCFRAMDFIKGTEKESALINLLETASK